MTMRMRVWVSSPNRTTPYPCLIPIPALRFRLKPTLPQALMKRKMDTASKRFICPSCSKPPRTCLCSRFQYPPLDNNVSVTILQHSLERNHPLNSTRIAKLGLKNVTVVDVSDVLSEARFVIGLIGDREMVERCVERGVEVCMPSVCENVCEKMESDGAEFTVEDLGVNADGLDGEIGRVFDDSVEAPTIIVTMGSYGSHCSCEVQSLPQLSPHRLNFDQILAVPEVASSFANGFTVKRIGDMEPRTEFKLNVPCGSILLFPSDTAVSVKDLKSSGIEVKNLIVLDGTWAKATRMYNENPWLKALPHLKLELDKSSLYGEVRTQPKEKCLSTIESIVYALKAIGDSPDGLDGLLDVFESMVGDQRRCMHERLSNLSQV